MSAIDFSLVEIVFDQFLQRRNCFCRTNSVGANFQNGTLPDFGSHNLNDAFAIQPNAVSVHLYLDRAGKGFGKTGENHGRAGMQSGPVHDFDFCLPLHRHAIRLPYSRILLVAHEGNFSTDLAEGKPGLAYLRKQSAGGTSEETLRASLEAALHAASLIEAEPGLEGRVRFLKDKLVVISNDRLLAPNNAATFEEVKPTLVKVFGAKADLTHASAGTKDRLTILVSGTQV